MKRLVLLILSFIYGAITDFRNYLFDKNILNSRKISKKIISIGNITAGGTGKTPMVGYISEKFNNMGLKTAIVSRGYKGSYQEDAAWVDANQLNAADKFGDEPTELAKHGHSVFVGKKRILACELAIRKIDPDIIICDDGFQHRYLKRDLDILLFDATQAITDYSLLPLGRARERISNISRADFCFITKCNLVSADKIKSLKSFLLSYGFTTKKIILYSYVIDHFLDSLGNRYNIDQLLGRESILFCGIGRPEAFAQSLLSLGIKVSELLSKTDHYNWNETEITALIKKCQDKDVRYLITTEKDYVKIKHFKLESGQVVILRAIQKVIPLESDNEVFRFNN